MKQFVITRRPRPIAQNTVIPVGVVAARLIRELTAREIEKRMAESDKPVGRQHDDGTGYEGEELC